VDESVQKEKKKEKKKKQAKKKTGKDLVLHFTKTTKTTKTGKEQQFIPSKEEGGRGGGLDKKSQVATRNHKGEGKREREREGKPKEGRIQTGLS